MSYLSKRWQLHTALGPADVLDGSRFAFDRAWSPQGAGQLRLSLADWPVQNLEHLGRRPLVLVCELGVESVDLTLGAATFGAADLGRGAWPRTTSTPFAPPGTPPQQPRRVAWRVYPGKSRRLHLENVLELEVSTAELQLVEARNGSGVPWMPKQLRAGRVYRVSEVLLELTRYLGIMLRIEPSTATVAAEDVPPWEPGESAWEWFDRVRLAAGLSYLLDPTSDSIRFELLEPHVVDELPLDWLEREDDLNGGRSDQLAYADAVSVLWTWTDRDGTQHEQREIALAPGITDWRDARVWHEATMRGRPIPLWADNRVRQLYRMRHLTTTQLPLDGSTLVDLGSGRGRDAQAIEYAIDEAPTVTMTTTTRG